MVMLTGFPVTEWPRLTESAYLVLGKLLGQPILQTRDGRLLARVEDTPDVKVPGAQRGRAFGEALPVHIDRCTDLIGLLVHPVGPEPGRAVPDPRDPGVVRHAGSGGGEVSY